MVAPDQAIPKDVLDSAECVAVFAQVIKAGFIVGGRGMASCRTPSGLSAPAFFNLGGGSFGLQTGAQATDFIFPFMNEKGMDSLLSSKFTLGGNASVAAGPVGRQAGAETDALMSAEALSYLWMPDIIRANARHHRDFLCTLSATIRGQMCDILRDLRDIIGFCLTS